MKRCGKCKEEKPLEDFSKNKSKPDGLQGMCRICKKEVDHIHHKNNKEDQQKRNNKNRMIRSKFVFELKSVPCLDCKQTFIPFAMDFDHVRGIKIADISKMVAGAISMKVLLAEIDKCEIVCATCHRIRTFNRMRLSPNVHGT